MWSRRELKNSAQEVLKQGYWPCFLVSLILLFVSGGGVGGSNNSQKSSTALDSYLDTFLGEYFFWIIGIITLLVFFGLASRFFWAILSSWEVENFM